MRITALTQKHGADDAGVVPQWHSTKIAGPGSAAVFGQPGTIGVLQTGAEADLILVDVSGFHCQPLHDLAGDALVLRAGIGRAHDDRRWQGVDRAIAN